jgi:hypothetical protein
MAAFRHGIGLYAQHMTPLQALAESLQGPRRRLFRLGRALPSLAEGQREREPCGNARQAAAEVR